MHYSLQDSPDEATLAVLGQIPSRWGRMDVLSRLALVEIGRLLREAGMLNENGHSVAASLRVGLVVGTERGSLHTDLAFAQDVKSGALVSPLLFSSTLANIPLAEAAVHYRLQGPVYALYSAEPLAASMADCSSWLRHDARLDFMIAGALDFFPVQQGSSLQMHRNTQFKLLSHAENNDHLPILAEDS